MNLPSLAEFTAQSLANGFDDVAERQWPAQAVADTHTHPFALTAIVVCGEMWLTVDGHTRHLQAGDAFSLECAMAHAERYGPSGATYWVARKF